MDTKSKKRAYYRANPSDYNPAVMILRCKEYIYMHYLVEVTLKTFLLTFHYDE